MAYEPFAAQRLEALHRLEIGGVLERPPVELKEIDRLYAEPLAAAFDALAHNPCCHGPRRWAPFGESGGARRPRGLAARNAGQKAPRDEFGRAVMVGHVEA